MAAFDLQTPAAKITALRIIDMTCLLDGWVTTNASFWVAGAYLHSSISCAFVYIVFWDIFYSIGTKKIECFRHTSMFKK